MSLRPYEDAPEPAGGVYTTFVAFVRVQADASRKVRIREDSRLFLRAAVFL